MTDKENLIRLLLDLGITITINKNVIAGNGKYHICQTKRGKEVQYDSLVYIQLNPNYAYYFDEQGKFINYGPHTIRLEAYRGTDAPDSKPKPK